MKDILAQIIAVKILSEELHYHSKGCCFYALHLLADRVKDGLDSDMDALRESYYMGQLVSEVPCTCELYEAGIKIVRDLWQQVSGEGVSENKRLVLLLRNAVHTLFCQIEETKGNTASEPLCSGVVAILDGVSQKMLIAHGLLDRTALNLE